MLFGTAQESLDGLCFVIILQRVVARLVIRHPREGYVEILRAGLRPHLYAMLLLVSGITVCSCYKVEPARADNTERTLWSW